MMIAVLICKHIFSTGDDLFILINLYKSNKTALILQSIILGKRTSAFVSIGYFKVQLSFAVHSITILKLYKMSLILKHIDII